MNAELVVMGALANALPLQAIIRGRFAATELPPNSAYPALTFDVVTSTPEPNVAGPNAPQLVLARVQFDCYGADRAQVKSIVNALRMALDFRHNSVIATKLVISIRADFQGPLGRDPESGRWAQSADFIFRFYE